MKIGTKELPDNCPNCGTKLIKTPRGRLVPEGGIGYSCYSMNCIKCKYDSEIVKIREDYIERERIHIEDVTPYKPNFIQRIFKK